AGAPPHRRSTGARLGWGLGRGAEIALGSGAKRHESDGIPLQIGRNLPAIWRCGHFRCTQWSL
ncbi:MAG TPA: hypothetical protein VKA78_01315, partial [Pyrinomonadaceae bacterium]|nr:hypothetical protein [Pyrinomonadaceae bacterium]